MSPAQLVAELHDEAEVMFAVSIVAMAKAIHKQTGHLDGEFSCPRCHTGTVTWAVSKYNGHASILCSTKYKDPDGTEHRCTSAME